MDYQSISEIKRDFKLVSDDVSILIESLSNIRNECHPDRTNGIFPSKLIEDKYHKSNNAITYLEKLSSNQSLMVIEKMTDLMKVVTQMIPNTKSNILEQNLDNTIKNTILIFKNKSLFPKISITGITAIVTFIFFFPKQVTENPALSQIINPKDPIFAIVWFIVVFCTCCFWFLTFRNDERTKRILAGLKVESYQNNLFQKFQINKEFDKYTEFTKDELTYFLYKFHLSRGRNTILSIHNKIFGSEIVTMEVAQNIADIIITRAERNAIISKIQKTSLSETFRFNNNS